MTLPDDDGTAEAEVAKFKRRRQLRLGVSGVALIVVLVVGFYFVTKQFSAFSTESDELAQVMRCDMNELILHYDSKGRAKNYGALTNKCNQVLMKLLRRLAREPTLCDRIAKKITSEKSWERKNRLLHVLMRYRRALYPEDESLTLDELRRQPCIEDPLVQMVAHWSKHRDKHKKPGGLIPGVADYNVHLLSQLRFLVTNTYVLQRVKLPRPVARRLAAHLLGQYRSLNQGASVKVRPAIKMMFDAVFYPLWKELGKPEPKPE